MGWIIWTILLLILIGICIPFYSWTRKRSQDQEQRPQFRADNRQASTILKWVMISLAAIIVLETFIFSFTTVSTKNVGIVTTFGATTGHLSNGAHMIAPWSKVTEMDAAIQTDSYTDADHNCLKVRIGNQQTACVSVSIRWRIDPNMAPFEPSTNADPNPKAAPPAHDTMPTLMLLVKIDALMTEGGTKCRPSVQISPRFTFRSSPRRRR